MSPCLFQEKPVRDHPQAMTIAEMAEDAFLKAENVKMLAMMNTPTDFEERKKAFVALAVAREAANKAQAALDAAVRLPATQ